MKLGFVFSCIVAYLLWLLFNASLEQQVLLFGVPVALAVGTLCSRFLFTGFKASYLSPMRFAYLVMYAADFIFSVFKSNISMAIMILQPKLDIVPAVFRIAMRTRSDWVVAGVSNSITLTPGTLTLDADDGFIYVHWIKAVELDSEKAKERIVGKFEKYLKGVFE